MLAAHRSVSLATNQTQIPSPISAGRRDRSPRRKISISTCASSCPALQKPLPPPLSPTPVLPYIVYEFTVMRVVRRIQLNSDVYLASDLSKEPWIAPWVQRIARKQQDLGHPSSNKQPRVDQRRTDPTRSSNRPLMSYAASLRICTLYVCAAACIAASPRYSMEPKPRSSRRAYPAPLLGLGA